MTFTVTGLGFNSEQPCQSLTRSCAYTRPGTLIGTETHPEGTTSPRLAKTLPHTHHAHGGEPPAAKQGVADTADPSTLTGYCPTGPERPVETDIPLLGFGAAGGVKPRDVDNTLSGYEATGGNIPQDAATLGGYTATGGEASVPGLQHTPITSKCVSLSLCNSDLLRSLTVVDRRLSPASHVCLLKCLHLQYAGFPIM
jgi:hypothetical protein